MPRGVAPALDEPRDLALERVECAVEGQPARGGAVLHAKRRPLGQGHAQRAPHRAPALGPVVVGEHHGGPRRVDAVSFEDPGESLLGAGAGVFQSSYVTLTPGKLLKGDDLSPEGVAAHWAAITDREGEIVPQMGAEQSMMIGRALQAG